MTYFRTGGESNCKCLTCGKEFHRPPSDIKRGNGKYCSMTCKQPWNKGMVGFVPWNIGIKDKRVMCKCLVCGKEFEEFRSGIKEGRGKHCSRKCADIGRKVWNKGVLGSMSGTDNGSWKGEFAGYMPKHAWINRILGKPKSCAMCGCIENRRYHWTNKDHKYRRVIGDWINLCPSCHYVYDHIMNPTEKQICFDNLKKI